jgi:hypothetical protein
VLFDRGRGGLVLKRLDVGSDRDGFNVFEVLITGTLDPVQELLDRAVVSGPGIRVSDRDCKKFKELFLG